jgi:hypothetical protein
MNHHSVITIPCFFVITLVYAISTATTTATAIATPSIPIEQQQHLVISKNIIDKHVTEEENSIFQLDTTIQTMVQQLQQWPDGESDENEPITDLPIIDSPCKSSCPPNYKLCLYICE